MIFEIIFYLILGLILTLGIAHYIIYKKHSGDNFMVRTFYMNPPDDVPNKEKYKYKFKPKMFEISMKQREILYITDYTNIKPDLDWLYENMKIKSRLQIQAEKYKTELNQNRNAKVEKYFIPLKEWYLIFKKKKHKEMKVHKDIITLEYFDYVKDLDISFRNICPNYFYYHKNFRMTYHSSQILEYYKRVHYYYTIITPINISNDNNSTTFCNIQLVHPDYNHSIYLKDNESKIISNRDIDYKEFPKSRNIKFLTVKVFEGDAIAIPYGWSYTISDFEGICIEYDIDNYAGMITRFMRLI
jgi:hypothetical protein